MNSLLLLFLFCMCCIVPAVVGGWRSRHCDRQSVAISSRHCIRHVRDVEAFETAAVVRDDIVQRLSSSACEWCHASDHPTDGGGGSSAFKTHQLACSYSG